MSPAGMMQLTAAELAELRPALVETFPQTCTVVVRTATDDGQGGERETWAERRRPVYPCELVQARESRELPEGGRVLVLGGWILRLPYGTPLDPRNRVRVAGQDYELTGSNVGDPQALCLECQVRSAR